jgi:hypothetical protein
MRLRATAAATLVAIACAPFEKADDNPPPPPVASAQDAGSDAIDSALCTDLLEGFDGSWSVAPPWTAKGAPVLESPGYRTDQCLAFRPGASGEVFLARDVEQRCAFRFDAWIDIPDADEMNDVVILRVGREGRQLLEVRANKNELLVLDNGRPIGSRTYDASAWFHVVLYYSPGVGSTVVGFEGATPPTATIAGLANVTKIELGLVAVGPGAPAILFDEVRLRY